MAYASTDLATVEAAIISLASGTRVIEVWLSGKKVMYHDTDLDELRKLRNEIRAEINAAAGKKRYFRTSTYKGL